VNVRDQSAGLYIHIPFCHARCGYCDFVTFTGKEDRIAAYVENLCCEMDLYKKMFEIPSPRVGEGLGEGTYGRKRLDPSSPPSPTPPLRIGGSAKAIVAERGEGVLKTIFFGGGTPSLLEGPQIARILQHARRQFLISADAEITMEANPESLTEDKARAWRAAGVNRLSLGLQAMDDALLKTMDRLHTVAEFHAAYESARNAGFDNINIDLIYGFPGQSMAAWQDTVQKTIALNPEHVSMYALAIEEHTPFAAQKITVNADDQGDMYAWARGAMSAAGYPQYEISNFARSGRECRHNLIYWRQQDYLAVGAGAVGCIGHKRWTNHKTLHAYEQDIQAGRLPRLSVETLTDQERRFERLMLGLRLREGLEWGEESNPAWQDQRRKLVREGHLEEIRPGRWRVTEKSVAFTNKVLLPFLD